MRVEFQRVGLLRRRADACSTRPSPAVSPVKSGLLGISLTLTPSGSSTLTGPISFSVNGPFQSRGTGKLPQSDFTIAISALGRNGQLGIVSTGTSGYVTLQGTAYQLPGADFQRLESGFSSVGGSSSGGGLSALGINPQHWLTNASVVGSDTVGGADTTHVRAGVNVTALLQDLNRFLAKASSSSGSKIPSSIPAATQQKIAAAIKNASVDIWTGKSDKILRKLSLDLKVPVTGKVSTLAGGLSSAAIGFTLQYSDVNQPQTIAAPSNVKPYSQFTPSCIGPRGREGSLGGGRWARGRVGLLGLARVTSTATSRSTASASRPPVRTSTKMQKCASRAQRR